MGRGTAIVVAAALAALGAASARAAGDLVSPADDAVSQFLDPIKTFRWTIPAGEQAYAIEIGHAALPEDASGFAKGTRLGWHALDPAATSYTYKRNLPPGGRVEWRVAFVQAGAGDRTGLRLSEVRHVRAGDYLDGTDILLYVSGTLKLLHRPSMDSHGCRGYDTLDDGDRLCTFRFKGGGKGKVTIGMPDRGTTWHFRISGHPNGKHAFSAHGTRDVFKADLRHFGRFGPGPGDEYVQGDCC